jgi:glycine oxidase
VLNHCVHGDDVYLVPRPSGELLVGATVERVGFQRGVTATGIADLLAAAIELCPALGGLPITRTWYGFRPWVPDSLPVLGPWPGVDGLFVATGHFRNGILLAPITARLMTEWITGREPSIDVKDFLPDRFVRRPAR